MVAGMQDEAQALIDGCVSLAYWMRGGATYGEIMHMTYGERSRLSSFIDKRLEIEKKNLHPCY